MNGGMVVYTDPAANNGSLIIQYSFTVRDTANPEALAIPVFFKDGPGSPTAFFTGLLPDHEYTVTVCAQNAAGWSVICPTSLPFKTYPLPPAFTLVPPSETKTYGEAITGYTINSTGGKIDSFSISPYAPAGLTFDPTTGLLSGTPTNAQDTTVYTVTGTNKSGSASATFTLTINKAIPEFTWADVSKLATALDWTLAPPTSTTTGTWNYVSGDTGVITLTGDVAHIVSAGTSLITATFTPTDAVNYVSGGTITMTITVTKDSQVITFDALTGKTYGDTSFGLTASASSDLPVSFASNTTDVCTVSGSDVTIIAAGTCSITASQDGNAFYLAAPDVTRSFTVGKMALTVTADAKTKVYGDADPDLTYSITTGSLVGSDTLAGTLSRESGENVGTYAITQGTLDAGSNYTLTYVGADLTITARAITVTADAKSKIYGSADPELTYSITNGSLKSGDLLSGALTRETGEDVGIYAISQGTLDNSNYDITYVGANLTITARAITVTADAKTKVYGSDDPELTYSITSGSLKSGDVLTGELARAAGENVGIYAISQGTLDNSNYAITYVGANLTITKAVPQFTWANVSKQSTDPDWTLTAPTSSTLGTFSYVSGNTGVITVSGATAHIVSAGSSLMTATFTPTDTTNYVSGGTVTMTITVVNAAVYVSLTWDCSKAIGAEQYFDGNEFKLCRAETTVPGNTVYTSSDTSVFTVTGSGGGQIGHPEEVANAYLIATFTPDNPLAYLVTTLQLTVHITGGSHPHWTGWQEP